MTSAAGYNAHFIPTLEGSVNYALWKVSCISALRASGVWKFVEGTQVEPVKDPDERDYQFAEPVKDPDERDYQFAEPAKDSDERDYQFAEPVKDPDERDHQFTEPVKDPDERDYQSAERQERFQITGEQARNIIISTCKPSIQQTLEEIPTAKACWEKLQTMYEPTGLLHKQEIWSQFPDWSNAVCKVPSSVVKWIAFHPKITTTAAALAVANGVVFLTPAVVTAPILAAVGFGAQGPIAGSIAASLQAGIGNVGGGSLFAYAQSAAMGGYGAGAVNGVFQACAVGGQAAAAWWWRKRAEE